MLSTNGSSLRHVECSDCKRLNKLHTGFLQHGYKWAKDHAVNLLKDKFIHANWIPAKINSNCSTSELLRLYTLKTTKIFPRQEYDKLNGMYVGANSYPNFLEFFEGTHGDIAQSYNVPFNVKNINKYSHKIQPRSIATPGKAKIVVYSIGREHRKLLELTYSNAPYVLSYNSSHFNQIMVQNITVNSYTAENCKTIYCIGLAAFRDHNSNYDNQLAIAYMYDINIQETATYMFSERLCKEFGLAEQYQHGDNSVSNHLLKTSAQMRQKYLYRPIKYNLLQ